VLKQIEKKEKIGQNKTQSIQQKRIAYQRLEVLDLPAGLKVIGLSSANMWNANNDSTLCKLDILLI